uniref:GOLD domain-containing protein n=1 Tax=Physcomitrium patens TaxID=3218 RepID=A0A2K1K738_PHYPA|nr:hypothetical protein PHYPA_011482 [Physcomitrium patens]
MKNNSWDHWRWLSVLGLMWLKSAEGIRFDLEHRECLMHEAEADGEFVHMFVKVAEELNPPPFRHIGVDVVIQSPGGHFIHTEKLKHQSQVHAGLLPWEFGSTINFTAVEKGRYKICFHNRGSWVETVILDMLHPDADYQEPVKDVLGDLSRRLVYKAVLEVFAIIVVSVLQVILLQQFLQKQLSNKQM